VPWPEYPKKNSPRGEVGLARPCSARPPPHRARPPRGPCWAPYPSGGPRHRRSSRRCPSEAGVICEGSLSTLCAVWPCAARPPPSRLFAATAWSYPSACGLYREISLSSPSAGSVFYSSLLSLGGTLFPSTPSPLRSVGVFTPSPQFPFTTATIFFSGL